MALEKYIENKLKEKDILYMMHQIIGYPDFETNEKVLEIFHKNNVDIVELQIPFSEPSADGPLFVKSNQIALDNGVTVVKCLEYIEKAARKYSFKILIMTYYNIVYQYGVEAFAKKCREIGVVGLIVPDAPVDEASDFYTTCKSYNIAPITIATPYSTSERLKLISDSGSGFIYYVPRKGITGTKTSFEQDILNRIRSVKTETGKYVAVGFGIQQRSDIDSLIGYCDIAIIGSKLQKVYDESGLVGVESFVKEICDGN